MTGDGSFIRSCDLALHYYRQAQRSRRSPEIARLALAIGAVVVCAMVLAVVAG